MVSVDRPNIGTVRVFPNPVSNGELTLLLPENTEEEMTVQLFSPAGQLLRFMTLGRGTNLLDVSRLVAGIYYLEVVDKPEWQMMKIVVQHQQ